MLKSHDSLQEECEKLNAFVAKHETEYQQMHTRHKKILETMQKVERTNADLVRLNEKSEAENVQLNEDVLLLKNVIYQLNAELEKYQDRLKEAGQRVVPKSISNIVDFKRPADDVKKVLESWGSVNTHVLGPLLDAYQESLLEKQELINQYEETIADFSARCKEIVTENECMHNEMEKLKLQVVLQNLYKKTSLFYALRK